MTEVYVGRIRSVATHAFLSVVTVGLWFLVWFTMIVAAMRRHRGTGPSAVGLVILFLLVPVVGWFLAPFLAARQVRRIQDAADADFRTSPWVPAVWGLVPVIGWAVAAGYLQAGLNRAWFGLHERLLHATTNPVNLQCANCSTRFDLLLHPFEPTPVACPGCSRTGEI